MSSIKKIKNSNKPLLGQILDLIPTGDYTFYLSGGSNLYFNDKKLTYQDGYSTNRKNSFLKKIVLSSPLS